MSSTIDPVGKSRNYGFVAPVASAGKIPDPYPVQVLPLKQLVLTEKDGNGWTYTSDTLTENVRTRTDPLGNTTSSTYDAQGNMLTKTEPGIGATTYTYDAYDSRNRLATVTDPLSHVGNRITKSGATSETYAYDSIYRLLQAVTPRGSENFTYDAVRNRLVGPGPRDTTYQHDAANRMTKGRQYSYTYDNNGNQTGRTTTNPEKSWTLTWDYENRLTKMERVKGAEKRTVTFKYDPFGRRIARYIHGPGIDEPLALERNGQFDFYHQDGLGSVTAITDSSRNVVQRYSYESFGNPRPTTN